MSSGLPVVYTQTPAHAEFLDQARAGVPVQGAFQPEPQNGAWRLLADVSQAIEAIRKLYFDRRLAGQLGRNGRSFAGQFSPHTQAEKWHFLLQDCLRSAT